MGWGRRRMPGWGKQWEQGGQKVSPCSWVWPARLKSGKKNAICQHLHSLIEQTCRGHVCLVRDPRGQGCLECRPHPLGPLHSECPQPPSCWWVAVLRVWFPTASLPLWPLTLWPSLDVFSCRRALPSVFSHLQSELNCMELLRLWEEVSPRISAISPHLPFTSLS